MRGAGKGRAGASPRLLHFGLRRSMQGNKSGKEVAGDVVVSAPQNRLLLETFLALHQTPSTSPNAGGGGSPFGSSGGTGGWRSMTSREHGHGHGIGSLGQGNLEIELTSNSQTESIYVDNVVFTGTSTLTEDLDDDNDGWSDVDEADCETDSLARLRYARLRADCLQCRVKIYLYNKTT